MLVENILVSFWILASFRVTGEIVQLQDTFPSLLRSLDDDNGLTDTLHVTLRRNDDNDVSIALRKNPRLGLDFPVYSLQVGENGDVKPVLTETKHDQTAVYYQDVEKRAYFSATCLAVSNSPCVRALTGNLLIDGVEHNLQPVHDQGGNSRYTAHRLEKVSRRQSQDRTELKRDYLEIPEDNLEGEEDYEYEEEKGYEVEEQDQDLEDLPTSELTERLLASLLKRQHQKNLTRHKRRETRKAYGVEILFILDFSVFEKFKESFSVNTTQRIIHYYTHVVNGVDLMYASLEAEFSIYVTISSMMIATTESSSLWTSRLGQTTDIYKAIASFKNWRRQFHRILPSHDHASLITASRTKNGVVGVAYVGGICTSYSVSVNQELDFFQTTATIAHELGHNLGARHDEDRNECPAAHVYIMTPFVFEVQPNTDTSNPWRFSQCSLDYFKRMMQASRSRCLGGRAVIWDEAEWQKHVQNLPGAYYSLQEQCILMHGTNAHVCMKTNDEQSICRGLGCQFPGQSHCTNYVAARGTPCGEQMICSQGRCIPQDLIDTTLKEKDRELLPDTPYLPEEKGNEVNAKIKVAFDDELPDLQPEARHQESNHGDQLLIPGDTYSPEDENDYLQHRNDNHGNYPEQEKSPDNSDKNPHGFECLDRGVGEITCKVMEAVNPKELCNNHYYNCCSTCSVNCVIDVGVGDMNCETLIAVYGRGFTCRAFIKNCCKTCLHN